MKSTRISLCIIISSVQVALWRVTMTSPVARRRFGNQSVCCREKIADDCIPSQIRLREARARHLLSRVYLELDEESPHPARIDRAHDFGLFQSKIIVAQSIFERSGYRFASKRNGG